MFVIVASRPQVSHFTFGIVNRRHIRSNNIACYSCVNWNLILHVNYRDIIVSMSFGSYPQHTHTLWHSDLAQLWCCTEIVKVQHKVGVGNQSWFSPRHVVVTLQAATLHSWIVERRQMWSNVAGNDIIRNCVCCDLNLYVYSMFSTETPSFNHILLDLLC